MSRPFFFYQVASIRLRVSAGVWECDGQDFNMASGVIARFGGCVCS
jgi:hypothetical protein